MRMRIPLLLFAVILLHGSLLGLSDDEAYYWVLAQKPALGYAFHPPAVAWLISLSQALTGWLFARPAAFVVRLPAAACVAGILALGLRWIELAGAPRERMGRAAAALLSFVGFFGLSWMMVPDLPLLLGWTLAFTAGWSVCFGKPGLRSELLLGLGVALSLLSKYSGVLAAGSAGLCVLVWAPRERKLRALAAVVGGALLAAIPVLYWNSRHEWASILYQVRERHGGGELSLRRYARFWLIEWALAGPILMPYLFVCLGRAWKPRDDVGARASRYALLWILPGALVFCLQPLWADFKPHWAFVVWWPVALLLGLDFARASAGSLRLFRVQVVYGLALGALVLIACHLPVLGWVFRGHDPRLDVTNDLYGWSRLPDYLKKVEPGLPVLGSRYQTASQAAFALFPERQATLLPRDLKALDEWPDLGVSDRQGPDWPRLTQPVLYVADSRYDESPQYPGAACVRLGRVDSRRWGMPAKWIDVWKCAPGSSRP